MRVRFVLLYMFELTCVQCFGQAIRKLWFANTDGSSSAFCGVVVGPYDQQSFELVDARPSFGCGDSQVASRADATGHVLGTPAGGVASESGLSMTVLVRGNCTFDTKLQNFANTSLLVVSEASIIRTSPIVNRTILANRTIILIEKSLLEKGSVTGRTLVVGAQPSGSRRYDNSTLVLVLLALLCVIVGGLWSANTRYSIYVANLRTEMEKRRAELEDGPREEAVSDSTEKETASVPLPLVWVLILVVIMVVFLVLLYFFYIYLIYIVLVLYLLGGTQAMCGTLAAVFDRFSRLHKVINLRGVRCVRSFCTETTAAHLVLFPLCLGIAIWWFVTRHQSYAWVLQNMIGIFFCVHLLNTLRLSSAKLVSFLLLGLFCYDVFFVYITPYFTKDGRSVMESVAVGRGAGSDGKAQEQLPIVFKVPKLRRDSALEQCTVTSYSLLGLGDIAIPGLFLSLLAGFDLLLLVPRRIYFCTGVTAYLVGLVLANITLFFTSSAQPALFFIVPCQLLTALAMSFWRGEFRILWSGDLPVSAVKRLIPGEYVPSHREGLPQRADDPKAPGTSQDTSQDETRESETDEQSPLMNV